MDREAWDERYRGADLVWSVEPNQLLVAEVEGLAPGRALDLGSGEGRNAIWLASQGWRVTAVDFSGAGMEKARRLAAKAAVEVDWVEVDVLDFEADEGAFDLVALVYLQLPPDERRAVLDSASRALATGGTLLVVAHHLENLARGYGGPQDATVLPTHGDLATEVPDLVVEKAEMVERVVETPEGERIALDALMRARRPT